jgi:hypothetical protein
MKRYMKYAMAVMLTSMAVACHTSVDEDMHVADDTRQSAIVLNVKGGDLGVDTRAEDMADTDRESGISHLDILIFNDAEDDADESLFHHERATAANSSGQVYLNLDTEAITIGAKYWYMLWQTARTLRQPMPI